MLKRQHWGALGLMLALSACPSISPPPDAPVFCHQWTQGDKQAQYQADLALSHDSALRPIIKDYERVCLSLGSKP